jgi:murein DD-endopeptidase MepM/ murein hydrolase activator NlpD
MLIQKIIVQLVCFIFLFILLISIFFIPVFHNHITDSSHSNGEIIDFNPNGFVWPLPGYTKISSPFGKRPAPTGGASSFHYGADIPAPPGTHFIAIHDGEITFRQFLGAGGFTITLSFGEYKVTYCHVDPNFIVSVGDKIKQGQVIGSVGPKNVYGVSGNPYHDEKGNPTNGATTGPHLHLGMRIEGEYVNPLLYF